MKTTALPLAALLVVSVAASATAAETSGSSISWSVFNPFRFYTHDTQFLTHLKQYNAIKDEHNGQAPETIIETIENRLNSGRCDNASDFDSCRFGWAHKTLGPGETCYIQPESSTPGTPNPFGYALRCKRAFGREGQIRDEDYVKPEFHAIEVELSDALKGQNPGQCAWTLQSGGSTLETEFGPCGGAAIIHDVPYRPGEADDGGVVVVQDETGKELAREPVIVKDTLVVGVGDSYASGEGNPDRPVTFAHGPTSIDYTMRDYGLPLRRTRRPIVLDRSNGYEDFHTDDMRKDYYDSRAGWTSPDCHRSQYSYQFRTALELAIEDRHRAVTLIHLACSGADTLDGFFRPMAARELQTAPGDQVASQLQTLLRLLCDDRPTINNVFKDIPTPEAWGRPRVVPVKVNVWSCAKLKRSIDVTLLSLGGNDVGFAPIVGYAIMDSIESAAPIADLAQVFDKDRFIFAPVPAYLPMMRRRLQIVAEALQSLLHVDPGQVVQTDYEVIPVSERNKPCPDTDKKHDRGMDAVSNLHFIQPKVNQAVDFALGHPGKIGFFDYLRCTSEPVPACGPGWNGPGWQKPTGFHLINTQGPFAGRGICAFKDEAERNEASIPRNVSGSEFRPTQPDAFVPYEPRQRLFVTVNDSYMKANTQRDCADNCNVFIPPIGDRLQLLMAGFNGGAFHRTAEGHAVVADAVMNQFLRAYMKDH